MNEITAQKAMYFLNKSQLLGSEVQSWMEVMSALDAIVNKNNNPSQIIPKRENVKEL